MIAVLAATLAGLALIGLLLWWLARGAEGRDRARRGRDPRGGETGAGLGMWHGGSDSSGDGCDSGGGGGGH
ncbi:MAG TPA: hypothetical protein VEX35_02415 [Allosphingosinicella sp.]|nr:hypothetical protein [Allosphingosinicella sp.]